MKKCPKKSGGFKKFCILICIIGFYINPEQRDTNKRGGNILVKPDGVLQSIFLIR